MNDVPPFPPADPPADPAPPPAPPLHAPLIDRVAKLEEIVANLTDLHNRFVEAAGRELGF